jgi:chaperonin cofactor prefoldin
MRTTSVLLGFLLVSATASALAAKPALPRFTEEREAAALFFVKKHLPDLLPLLGELKKNKAQRYQQEISEIFQVTEMLADLQDEPKRHDLELKIWKAENKAHLLVGRLLAPPEEERKKLQEQLRELARELVDLDIQVLEAQAEQLDKERGEVRDELSRAREQVEQNVKTRYEGLLDKSKKPRK